MISINKSINNNRGFSLVELAVVVTLIGILMTFGIKLAGGLQDRSAFDITRSKQTVVKNALISYLAQNGNLPCPATVVLGSVPTGIEDRTSGVCTSNNPGIVPFSTLGLPRDSVIDGWGRFFTYEAWQGDTPATYCTSTPAVTNYGNWTVVAYFLGDSANRKTYHDGEDGCLTIQEDANSDGIVDNTRRAVAVIISHGSNGFGGFTPRGAQIDYSAVGSSSPEKDNIVGHPSKISHQYFVQQINNAGYDDLVLEIGANDLLQPLKNSGTIVSINQIAGDYLIPHLQVQCTTPSLTKPIVTPYASITFSPVSGALIYSPVTVNFKSLTNYPSFDVTQTVSPILYACLTGFTY